MKQETRPSKVWSKSILHLSCLMVALHLSTAIEGVACLLLTNAMLDLQCSLKLSFIFIKLHNQNPTYCTTCGLQCMHATHWCRTGTSFGGFCPTMIACFVQTLLTYSVYTCTVHVDLQCTYTSHQMSSIVFPVLNKVAQAAHEGL